MKHQQIIVNYNTAFEALILAIRTAPDQKLSFDRYISNDETNIIPVAIKRGRIVDDNGMAWSPVVFTPSSLISILEKMS